MTITMNLQWKQSIRICWIKKLPAAVKIAWSKAVYLSQAVTRQTLLQLVPAPPDPNQVPPDPSRAPPDPSRAPPCPDPARKPSWSGPGRLALIRCCHRRCQSGDGDCIGVGMPPSPLPPLAQWRQRRWCRNADGVVAAAPATVVL